MPKPPTPHKSTLEKLKKRGYRAATVEHYNTFGGVTNDLFGFIDILAIRQGEILGIQATSGANHSARRKKILIECAEQAAEWLRAGGRIQIWSWSITNPKTDPEWRERIEDITLERFDEEV